MTRYAFGADVTGYPLPWVTHHYPGWSCGHPGASPPEALVVWSRAWEQLDVDMIEPLSSGFGWPWLAVNDRWCSP
jgi:hypothetical protein